MIDFKNRAASKPAPAIARPKKSISSFFQTVLRKLSLFFHSPETKAYTVDPCLASQSSEYHFLLDDCRHPFLQLQIHLN